MDVESCLTALCFLFSLSLFFFFFSFVHVFVAYTCTVSLAIGCSIGCSVVCLWSHLDLSLAFWLCIGSHAFMYIFAQLCIEWVSQCCCAFLVRKLVCYL